MKEKRLLILGGPLFQVPFILQAKKMHFYVGVIDINEDAPGKDYADEFFCESIKNLDGVLNIARKFKPDGVIVGMVDAAIPACAYIASRLGLNGMDMDTAMRVTNKYKMIEAFKNCNVPHPMYQYIPQDRIGKDKIDIEYPIIIKPVDMAGSRGIFLVENENELMNAIKSSSKAGDSGDIIVEEYMDGPEVSVELIVKNGEPNVIQITDKTTSGAPHFAETGHLQPSQLSDDICEQIRNVACSAVKALGLINCLGHAEIRITRQGPKMVEIGARAGGDAIGEQLLELSTGINFPEIAINIAFGIDFDIPRPKFHKSSCIRFLTTQRGILNLFEGINEARNIPGVCDVIFTGKIGNSYEEVIDSSGRIGFIITQSDNANDAKKACDDAYTKLKIEYME